MARRRPFDGIIIAHLGNTDGRQPENENKLAYVQKALKEGWHVCVDVVYHCESFLLPYDGGFNAVPGSLLAKPRVWCRAHDPVTLDALCNINAHAFLNTASGLALTSSQFVWTLPNHALVARSIACFPEEADDNWLGLSEPAGLCSDEPRRYI
jgi:hypothetical protein